MLDPDPMWRRRINNFVFIAVVFISARCFFQSNTSPNISPLGARTITDLPVAAIQPPSRLTVYSQIKQRRGGGGRRGKQWGDEGVSSRGDRRVNGRIFRRVVLWWNTCFSTALSPHVICTSRFIIECKDYDFHISNNHTWIMYVDLADVSEKQGR